jgi:hypothetical protein
MKKLVKCRSTQNFHIFQYSSFVFPILFRRFPDQVSILKSCGTALVRHVPRLWNFGIGLVHPLFRTSHVIQTTESWQVS